MVHTKKGDKRPALSIDWDMYLPLLEDTNIPDAEKRALIEAVWSIVMACVDLGFSVHPTQLVNKQGCEQKPQSSPSMTPSMVDLFQSKQTVPERTHSKRPVPQKEGRPE